MQSSKINSYKPLSEILSEIIDLTRGNVEAAVLDVTDSQVQLFVTNDEFNTDFIFSDNPANKSAEKIRITKGSESANFEFAKLQADGTILVDINSSLPLSIGDSVNVLELAPFFFHGNETSLYLLEKAQPAIMLLSPHAENIEFSSGYSSALDGTHRVQLVITDFSDDYNENDTYLSVSSGYLAPNRTKYVEKPLRVRLNKIISELEIYRSEVGDVKATIQVQDKKAFFVPFMGKQYPNFIDPEAENVSGWVLEVTLKVSGSSCIAQN